MSSIIPYKGALLNPRRDSTFKALFSDDSVEAKTALRSFLEAVLEAEIHDIQLAPNELSGEATEDKQPRFDITCTIDGEKVNVEMQNFDTFLNYAKRAEYYVAHLLNHYSPKSQKWKDMPKVYQVSVLNFVFDTASDKAISHYLMKTEDGRSLTARMNIFVLELPKVPVDLTSVEKLTPVERWCTFLRYADDPEKKRVISSLCKAEAGIMAASTVLSRISQDEAAWLAETSRDMAERDYLDLVGAVEDARTELAEKVDEFQAELAKQKAENARLLEEIARLKAQQR